MNKRPYDVLASRQVEAADNFIAGEHGHEVPLIIKTAYEKVKQELRRLNRIQKQKDEVPKVSKKQKEQNGHHPAITGLSVGGFKELLDWMLAIATEGDKYGREFIELSFVDGGLTAIIAGFAAWLAKGSKK